MSPSRSQRLTVRGSTPCQTATSLMDGWSDSSSAWPDLLWFAWSRLSRRGGDIPVGGTRLDGFSYCALQL